MHDEDYPDGYPYGSFELKIELGNEAMKSLDDIARMLESIAEMVRNGAGTGRAMDDNGNSVATWAVTVI